MLRPRKRLSRRKMGRVIHHRKSDESLVVLDNPDDGEIYTTGDAADVAGASRMGLDFNGEGEDEEEE